MSAAVLKRVAALDPRVVLALIGAALFLVAFQSWVALRGPWAELRALETSEIRLNSVLQRGNVTATELATLSAELAALEKTLSARPVQAEDAMLPALITTLDRIATRHDISLGSVRPPTQRPVPPFEEVSFQVEARGPYRGLYAWMGEVLAEVQPLVATDVAFKAVEDGQRVAVTIKLSLYRTPATPTAARP